MAVVKATIKTQLLALYNSAKSSPMTEDDFADEMATIIRAAILSADISVSTSVAVASVTAVTPGGGVSGPGTGTGSGTGTIS
jgi:hypothetical protein